MKNTRIKKITFLSIKSHVIIFLTITLMLFGLTGCGGDDGVPALLCGGGNWLSEIEEDTTKYLESATKYSQDPTKENCEAFKKASLNYVEAYKSVAKCVPGVSKKTYEQAFDELKDEVNSIDCN